MRNHLNHIVLCCLKCHDTKRGGKSKDKIYEDICVMVGKKLMFSADKMTFTTALNCCASCRSMKKSQQTNDGSIFLPCAICD